MQEVSSHAIIGIDNINNQICIGGIKSWYNERIGLNRIFQLLFVRLKTFILQGLKRKFEYVS